MTEEQYQEAFRAIVGPDVLERLDTRLGTEQAVKWLQANLSDVTMGWTLGPGEVSWLRDARGYAVVVGEERSHMPWSNLANRATIAACELRREDAARRALGV